MNLNDVFSLVVKHTSIQILLSLVAMKDLKLEQLDVKTAFLHGDLEEQIYMKQPEGFEITGKEDHVCLLKKFLYDLKLGCPDLDKYRRTLYQIRIRYRFVCDSRVIRTRYSSWRIEIYQHVCLVDSIKDTHEIRAHTFGYS
jgi:Reverse transcriptase (RNA-dependent DNA polymerase)